MTRRLLTLCLASALWVASSPPALAGDAAKTTTRPTAALDIRGRVSVDGEPSVSGQTIFSGSEVETGQGSVALVGLGNFGQAKVLPQSHVRLEFGGERLGVSLASGGVRLLIPVGVSAAVEAGGCVVTSDGTGPAAFTLKREGGRVKVSAHAGRLTAHAGGRRVPIGAGQQYTSGAEKADEGDGMNGRKKLALILTAAGIAMLIGIVITAAAEDEELDFGDEIIIPSAAV